MLDVFFDKYTFSEFGLCLEERPAIPTPEREVIHYDNIDRLDGSLTEYKSWKDIQVTLNVNLMEDTIMARLREFKGSILNLKTFRFTLSDRQDYFYIVKSLKMGNIENEIAIKGSFTIDLTLDPFEYYIYQNILTGVDSVELRNNGSYFSLPIIIVDGIGDVVIKVNDKFSMTLKDLTKEAVINCDKQEYYDRDNPLKRSFSLYTKEFPHLSVGINKVTATGTVKALQVSYSERWL